MVVKNSLYNEGRSKKKLLALTSLTIVALLSVLTVYAVVIGNFTGGEVTVGGVGSSTVTYSLDNSEAGTWSTTAAPASASSQWYSRLEINAGDYSGPVTITWKLQQKIDATNWADVSGATATTNIVLSGVAENVYATSDGAYSTSNHDWGADVTEAGTYRVVVSVESA